MEKCEKNLSFNFQTKKGMGGDGGVQGVVKIEMLLFFPLGEVEISIITYGDQYKQYVINKDTN